MPSLPASARRVLKATYVPVRLAVPTAEVGAAVQKYAFVRQLGLQPGETAAVGHAAHATAVRSISAKLAKFEGVPLPSELPGHDYFATTPVADLLAFGHALSTHRRKQLEATSPANADTRALATHLLNASLVATNLMSQVTSTSPLGMLNLERLEMYPAGIERGELIATIPLAPLEQTAVVQKEWSVTSQEFTSIVTDSLENYSETGVTENTELAQSTTSQTQHANQFNVNATVSGSVNFATIASASANVSTGAGWQDQNSASASDSAKHAIATTKKASSRVKQEHKVTISTSTVSGTSETTTRTLQNPSPTQPMRVDYFSLMRKWYVGLYRYGLRLTYDIVIPEPGATLRQQYEQLAELQSKLSQALTLPFGPTDLNASNWQSYANELQATLTPPPPTSYEVSFTSSYSKPQGAGYVFVTMEIDVPDGYSIASAKLTANQAVGPDPNLWPIPFLNVMFVGQLNPPADGTKSLDATASLDYLTGRTGKQYVTYGYAESNGGVIEVDVQLQDAGALAAWQEQSWQTLYSAAQQAYYTTQQSLQNQITVLQNRLGSVDTLTLRREENDEITKGVLRWLLGPNFSFMPDYVASLFSGPDASWGVAFEGNQLGLSLGDWSVATYYEQMVRFVNDAIDWDNILYFLYSYFWDVPSSWDNIRQIQHPDATRQAFLRAGSARVVLTVRKGWEKAWVQFVETGIFGGGVPHPYLSIAQEIYDYDNMNYPGIPPANPGSSVGPDDGAYVATASPDKAGPSTTPVTLTVASSAGFIVGYDAIIDRWDPSTYDPTKQTQGVQEIQQIVGIPDATHITVKALSNAHDGSMSPFPVIQVGEKGLLVAQWFEYTPTSGTDIAVTSDLSTVA